MYLATIFPHSFTYSTYNQQNNFQYNYMIIWKSYLYKKLNTNIDK